MMFFLVFALATWRISSLLVEEEGPFCILDRLRIAVGIAWDENSDVYGKNVVAEIFLCVWCMSMWVGVALTIAYVLAPTETFYIMLPFALSAVAAIINEYARY